MSDSPASDPPNARLPPDAAAVHRRGGGRVAPLAPPIVARREVRRARKRPRHVQHAAHGRWPPRGTARCADTWRTTSSPSRECRTGASTGGENRWLPAKPPKPWDGELPASPTGRTVRSACTTGRASRPFLAVDDGWQSEDMYRVNIWTSSLTGKRPVMFYIHGGGFHVRLGLRAGLAGRRTDGAAPRRRLGDRQPSPQHPRLPRPLRVRRHADSVNVGMTDLVAALRWVRDNIANFGGNPDSMIIYGQSGGGIEGDETLLGMPSAEGLVHGAHRAQSGGGGKCSRRRAVPGRPRSSPSSASRTWPRCRSWSGPG